MILSRRCTPSCPDTWELAWLTRRPCTCNRLSNRWNRLICRCPNNSPRIRDCRKLHPRTAQSLFCRDKICRCELSAKKAGNVQRQKVRLYHCRTLSNKGCIAFQRRRSIRASGLRFDTWLNARVNDPLGLFAVEGLCIIHSDDSALSVQSLSRCWCLLEASSSRHIHTYIHNSKFLVTKFFYFHEFVAYCSTFLIM